MLAATLARGSTRPGPRAPIPFEQGPACTLLRARPQASLIFVGDEGYLEAHVDGHDHRAVPPLRASTSTGRCSSASPATSAAADAVVAYGADGAPLGTYLRRPGGLRPVIDVRDETSAPVAALRDGPRRGGGGFDLVRDRRCGRGPGRLRRHRGRGMGRRPVVAAPARGRRRPPPPAAGRRGPAAGGQGAAGPARSTPARHHQPGGRARSRADGGSDARGRAGRR